jgi:cyclophilin family peptidyl-prolyl cis-trans isomerase
MGGEEEAVRPARRRGAIRRLCVLISFLLLVFTILVLLSAAGPALTFARAQSEKTVRILPDAVAAGIVKLTIVGAAPGDRIMLHGMDDGSGGAIVELTVPDAGGPITVPDLRAGQYNITHFGISTGQLLTVAQPFPPKPLVVEDGTVVALRSVNFATHLLQARPDAVVIERPRVSEAAAVESAAMRVSVLPTHCGGASKTSGPPPIVLESCAYPGMLLAHGRLDKALLRLALPPLSDERSCNAASLDMWSSVAWRAFSPGLGGAETVSLSAYTSGPAMLSRRTLAMPLFARHSNSKLQLSATAPSIGDLPVTTDKLLAADGSWRLVPPGDQACAQLAQGSDARARRRDELMKPTARVKMTITVGESGGGELTIDLYGKLLPKTVDNFVRLCSGEGGYTYVNSRIQRVMPGFMAQGGSTDGGYGVSSWGGKFEDESFALQHDARGVLSMANAGEDTNGSQFFILFRAQPHLDGKHVVFGRLATDDDGGVSSFRVLDAIEKVGTGNGSTSSDVKIARCEVVRR